MGIHSQAYVFPKVSTANLSYRKDHKLIECQNYKQPVVILSKPPNFWKPEMESKN